MVLSTIAFAAVVTAASADEPTDLAWYLFQNQFSKIYNGDSEEAMRKGIFSANFAHAQEHNKGDSLYKLGVNQFSDLTEAEWKATYTGARPPSKDGKLNLGTHEEQVELADSVDWNSMGAVTPVKDQGQCGSCWAFSTTGALEGSHQVSSGRLVSLAEQQLVDCDTASNQGCQGGWPYDAIDYVSASGSCKESSYPYRGTDGNSCNVNSCTLALPQGAVAGYMNVRQTENALMSAVMGRPVSITVFAEGDFQAYSSGIFMAGCNNDIDHAVLAVGYGTIGEQAYWRIKNSWSTTWGDGGYMNLQRGLSGFGGQGAACILGQPPSYAVMNSAAIV